MRNLTAAEALTALGNGEKITSDILKGSYIVLKENTIIDEVGNTMHLTIANVLFGKNLRIYQEFTYPMWFKNENNQCIVKFTSLKEGKTIIKGNSTNSIGYSSDYFIAHTDKETWQQVEEPKKRIKVAKYAIKSNGSHWYETSVFYKDDAECHNAQADKVNMKRLDYAEIEVEDY